MNLSSSGMNTEFIRYMKYAGAFVNLKDKILVQLVSSCESCLRYILWFNFNLMITRPQINLREYFGPLQLIKQDINARQWVLVLDGYSIEWSIIHTHA
jgi:hypothetical protein